MGTFRKTGEAAGNKDGSLTWPISDSGHSTLEFWRLSLGHWILDTLSFKGHWALYTFRKTGEGAAGKDGSRS